MKEPFPKIIFHQPFKSFSHTPLQLLLEVTCFSNRTFTLGKQSSKELARRDKKASLSDQCKEIEENNRMGKTRDLFKKIRDTKETFHSKMGSIKDRNGMDITEAEDIKNWQEYTEELYKKIFTTQIITKL